MASTGMSEGVPSEGGFLIHKQFATEIYERIYAGAVLAPRTTRVPIGEAFNGWDYTALDESSRVTGVRHGGVRIYRLNEGGTLTASKLKFKRGELKLEKQIGLYYATDEQLKDSVALGAYMSRKFESAFAFEFDDEIFRGNGAGEPLGILNAGCLVSVAKETGQSAATIVAENIMKMFSRMYSGSLANAVWYVNQDCWPQIFQLHLAIGTGGVPLFIPAGQIANAPFGALLGRPIQPIEQASTLGTVGDIVFADFGQYITIDKGGLQADSSIHVQFLTDESTFRFILRNNGQPSPDWATALTPYKGSATVSPFVALAAR